MMKTLTVIGLLLDIVGAFLLGVEAIKLENIRVFKHRVLDNLHSHSLSPRLFFVDDGAHNERVAELGPRLSETWPRGLFQGLHWVAGLLVLILAQWITHGLVLDMYIRYWAWATGLAWYFGVPLGLWSLLVSFSLIWGVGELVHLSLEKSLFGAIHLADFVLSRTQAGITGICGMAILVLGFSCQVLGTVLS